MEIINIFKRSQYFICFIFLLITHIILLFYQDYVRNQLALITFKITSVIILIHYLYCIVMESEFKTHYIKIVQIHFENYLSIVSLITTISVVINISMYFILNFSLANFSDNCNFYIDKLHSQKKCELYNININTQNPYQFICTYNPEKDQFPHELTNVSQYENSLECSDNESLIYNNEVIEEFKPKFIGNNFYYCDLKFEPESFYLMEEYKCNIFKKRYFMKMIITLHLLYCNFGIIYFVLINIYFKNIKANVINIVIMKYD